MSNYEVPEKQYILLFSLECIRPQHKNKVFMREVFDAYQLWRKDRKLEKSTLSLISFGKFFPKTYRRKKMWRDGEIERGLLDVKLVRG